MNIKNKIINFNLINEYGLSITQCGITTALGFVESIPHLYDSYVFSFVTKGIGTYSIDGSSNDVKKGDAFLTTPNSITCWTSQRNNPLQFLFFVIKGTDLPKVLLETGLGSKSRVFTYLCEQDESIIQKLFLLLDDIQNDDLTAHDVLGYFYHIIGYIIKNKNNLNLKSSTEQDTYFERTIIFINNNYSNNITIHDIATFLSIDRTHLYRIFKTKIGISPMQYLNDYRLEVAKQLLSYPDFSNTRIALASGFYDYSHFSHAFKKKYGLTPGKYRKQLHTN